VSNVLSNLRSRLVRLSGAANLLGNRPTASPQQPSDRGRWLKWGLPIVPLLLFGGGSVAAQLTGGNRSTTVMLTQPVHRQTVTVTIAANGTIAAERSINLGPKTAGIVKALLVKEGDRVSQGQVIAFMDDADLQGQLMQRQGQLAQQQANLARLMAGNRPQDIAQAEAQLAERQAQLQLLRSGNRPQEIAQAVARSQQAQATLKQRESDYQRYQELFQDGAISAQTLDQKRTDYEVAQRQAIEAAQALALQQAGNRQEDIAQAIARVRQQQQAVALLKAGSRVEDVAQAKAQVQSARGDLRSIQTQLQDTKITAPFDGIVIKKYADVGSFVSPSVAGGSESASSSSILILASDRQEVVVNLAEAQIRNIRLNQPVSIQVDAFPDQQFRGRVARIAPKATVSQNVTSFEVYIAIDDARSNQLKAGMNVEAEFEIGQLASALLVPNAAVVRRAEGEGVYILGADRNPVFRKIETGLTVEGSTEVKTGLQGNEQVLVSPPSNLDSGSKGFSILPKAPPPP